MTRHTQTILYHLLPAVFWLLAIGGSVVPIVLAHYFGITLEGVTMDRYPWGFLVAGISMLCLSLLRYIRRHLSSVEECLQIGLMLGIVSYWLPSVLFLIVPAWIYLMSRNLFSFRSFVATFIGLTAVAIWAVTAIYLGWIDNPWAEFFAPKNLWAWLPTGSFLAAYIGTTIVQQNLRVR